MLAFHPFDSAENALENMHALTEHEITEDLRVRVRIVCANLPSYYSMQNFLDANIPKGKKAGKFPLGVVSVS